MAIFNGYVNIPEGISCSNLSPGGFGEVITRTVEEATYQVKAVAVRNLSDFVGPIGAW